MNKIFLLIILFFIVLAPSFASIQAKECPPPPGQNPGIVRCGQDVSCPCEILDFFGMFGNIYTFIVKDIAMPIAVVAIVIAAIIMMMSAGNPNLFSKGKNIMWVAIIGLVLVFCSWLIIDFILAAIGYGMPSPWWKL